MEIIPVLIIIICTFILVTIEDFKEVIIGMIITCLTIMLSLQNMKLKSKNGEIKSNLLYYKIMAKYNKPSPEITITVIYPSKNQKKELKKGDIK